MSSARSDPFDARVLADFLRTDHAHLHALQPSSEPAQELKLLARDHQRLVSQHTRLLNQLTATLKDYYPRPLEAFDDLASPLARAFLDAFPTPLALAAFTATRWQKFVRKHRLSAARAAKIWDVLQRPQLPVPAHVVRAKARLLRALLDQLATVGAAVAEYRDAIHDFFARMPAADWARSLPGGKSGTTVPTLWAELGDAAGRWQSLQHLQAQAGTVPVTERSGKLHVVRFRFGCSTQLRYAVVHRFAFLSLRHSEWALAYYQQQRARGHPHHRAVRALGAKRLKIIFALWTRHLPYEEAQHLATIARQSPDIA